MKRFFLTVAILLVASITAFAQQPDTQRASSRPTSAQTRESASQMLGESRTSSSQFDSVQADLITRNTSNSDAFAFIRLRNEIQRLESAIMEEQNRIAASLDRGIRVNQDRLDRVQQLIDQHKAKMTEMETFISAR